VNTSPLVRISVWLPMICNLEYVVITGWQRTYQESLLEQ
jgi:hypothetical protein